MLCYISYLIHNMWTTTKIVRKRNTIIIFHLNGSLKDINGYKIITQNRENKLKGQKNTYD